MINFTSLPAHNPPPSSNSPLVPHTFKSTSPLACFKDIITVADNGITVTRSYKLNSRDHVTDAMTANESLPRLFGKSGPTDSDPRKTKKDGAGKGNW